MAARHRARVPPRRGLARAWLTLALVAATLGLGALLPGVRSERLASDVTPVSLAPAITAAPPSAGAPAVPASPAAMSRSVPVRFDIPALHVSAPIVPVGLARNRSLQVPAGTSRAGWYDQSPTPGEVGPAVLAAHVDWAGKLGVFHDIRELNTGDAIRITRQDGSVASFRIDAVAAYPKNALPIESIFGPLSHPGLRLITCGGEFDRATGEYEDNVVAFATFVPSS